MATLEDADGSAADDGADRELVTPGDADGEQTLNSPERRHVDALLDISEEDMFKELEPHEYHCYSGWEEAVSEWISPLCLSLSDLVYVTFINRLYQLSQFGIRGKMYKCKKTFSNEENKCIKYLCFNF